MHRAQAYFLTGTDTGVGKTYAACALLRAAQARGQIALGMKPVAAGLDEQGRNEDIERLIAASSFSAKRRLVNQYAFRAAIAPHLAAEDENIDIEFANIATALTELRTLAQFIVVEGIGGFIVPLTQSTNSADLAVSLGLPVILVVGLRLGCLNHALLTVEAIAHRGLQLAGWIANCIDPSMDRWYDNLASLRQRIAAPLLGTLPHQAESAAADALSVP
jgi:dethiobiotin synthetase